MIFISYLTGTYLMVTLTKIHVRVCFILVFYLTVPYIFLMLYESVPYRVEEASHCFLKDILTIPYSL